MFPAVSLSVLPFRLTSSSAKTRSRIVTRMEGFTASAKWPDCPPAYTRLRPVSRGEKGSSLQKKPWWPGAGRQVHSPMARRRPDSAPAQTGVPHGNALALCLRRQKGGGKDHVFKSLPMLRFQTSLGEVLQQILISNCAVADFDSVIARPVSLACADLPALVARKSGYLLQIIMPRFFTAPLVSEDKNPWNVGTSVIPFLVSANP